MNSFSKIEKRMNFGLQSISSCHSNVADNCIKQKRGFICSPVNLKTEQLCLIDLTVDECISPVQEQIQTEIFTNIENKKSTSKRKNVTSNKAGISSIYSSTSTVEPTKTQLKQTQLNFFFSSAKKIPQSKKDLKWKKIHSQFKKDDNAPNECKSLKKCITCYRDFDLCECFNVKMNEIEFKTLEYSAFEQTEEPMPQKKSDKGLIINNYLQNRTNGGGYLERPFVKEGVIDLCLDSSSEIEDTELVGLSQLKVPTKSKKKRKKSQYRSRKNKSLIDTHDLNVEIIPINVSSSNTKNPVYKTLPKSVILSEPSDFSDDSKSVTKESITPKKRSGMIESEKNECPPYKVIEGTTFAVDAFNYGILKNVTAYFLTHFHTDHYVGLTKKFSMPIYASKITTNLIRGFISVDEKLLNILFLNTTVEIEGVYVTAIDANHCPGAIMLLFQLPCGKRILHTGDFRWSPKMEHDPYLNQEHIELIYLDTTHISDKHIISSQSECISKAIHWVREFKQRNENKKILFVVCTDVIGKENFWLSIAKAFDMKVWSDGKRKKALSIIGNEDILKRLVSNATEADLHVVSHAEAGYRHLDEYFRKFSNSYDMVLSIKPKGSDSKDPEFVGPVNSVSVRYSEHSTHKELRRFLRFLLPNRVISTVPSGKNIFRCPKIPMSWHSKELYMPYTKQASILNYVSVKRR